MNADIDSQNKYIVFSFLSVFIFSHLKIIKKNIIIRSHCILLFIISFVDLLINNLSHKHKAWLNRVVVETTRDY